VLRGRARTRLYWVKVQRVSHLTPGGCLRYKTSIARLSHPSTPVTPASTLTVFDSILNCLSDPLSVLRFLQNYAYYNHGIMCKELAYYLFHQMFFRNLQSEYCVNIVGISMHAHTGSDYCQTNFTTRFAIWHFFESSVFPTSHIVDRLHMLQMRCPAWLAYCHVINIWCCKLYIIGSSIFVLRLYKRTSTWSHSKWNSCEFK